MKKTSSNPPQPLNEMVLKSDSFTYHEYCLIREGLFFLEQRPRKRDLRDLIIKLDRLFLPLAQSHQP